MLFHLIKAAEFGTRATLGFLTAQPAAEVHLYLAVEMGAKLVGEFSLHSGPA